MVVLGGGAVSYERGTPAVGDSRREQVAVKNQMTEFSVTSSAGTLL